MFVKLLNPFVKFLFNFWTDHFVICPYVSNEAKYMAKGVKPFSAISDDKRFLEEYEFPKFNPLVEQGIVLESRSSKKITNYRGENITVIRVYYYYPGEEWRIKKWEFLQKNYLKYKKSCPIREGLLLGYPRKYIRRHRLNSKIGMWLYNKGFRTHPDDV